MSKDQKKDKDKKRKKDEKRGRSSQRESSNQRRRPSRRRPTAAKVKQSAAKKPAIQPKSRCRNVSSKQQQHLLQQNPPGSDRYTPGYDRLSLDDLEFCRADHRTHGLPVCQVGADAFVGAEVEFCCYFTMCMVIIRVRGTFC